MSPGPPHQVMEVAAKLIERAIRRNNFQPLVKGCSALAADSCSDLGRLIGAVPGNTAVTALVKSGSIDRADRLTGARVPVLAIGPMVVCNWNATNPAKRHLIRVGVRVPPFTPIAEVESTV